MRKLDQALGSYKKPLCMEQQEKSNFSLSRWLDKLDDTFVCQQGLIYQAISVVLQNICY